MSTALDQAQVRVMRTKRHKVHLEFGSLAQLSTRFDKTPARCTQHNHMQQGCRLCCSSPEELVMLPILGLCEPSDDDYS